MAGLPFRGKRGTFSVRGRGPFVRRLRVNARTVEGTCKVPADLCSRKRVRVEIERATRAPRGPQLVSADGARVSGVEQAGGTLRVRLAAPGAVRVWVQAAGRLTALWNGGKVGPKRSGSSARWSVLLLPGSDGYLDGELVLRAD